MMKPAPLHAPFDEPARALAMPAAALAIEPRGGFVLRDVVATAFLRRRLLLAAFLVPVALGLVAAAVVPERFIAEGLMIVLGSRESAGAQDIAGLGPSVLSVDQPKIVQSEINIILSDDVITDAVRAMGPATLYPAVADRRLLGLLPPWPQEMQVQRAAELFARDLHADVEPNSSIVRVQYSFKDRTLAVQALKALFAAYLARRETIFDHGNAEFLSSELARVSAALEGVGRDIEAVKTRLGVLDVHQAFELAGARTDALDHRADTVREQQVAAQAQLAAARTRLAEQTNRVFASQETTNQAPNDDSRNALLKLQVERDHLAGQYTAAYPPLQELDRKIATTRQAIATAARSAFSTTREIRNPAVDLLTSKVVALQVDTASLDRQLAEVERQLAQSRERGTDLLAAESKLAALGRRQAALDAIYRQFAVREAGARVDEAARRTSTANVHVIQQPVAPTGGRSMALSYGAIGVFAGLLAAVATAVGLTWLRRTFASPAEAQRALLLPPLATFPVGERFDVAQTSPAVASLAAMLLDLPANGAAVKLVQFIPASADEAVLTAQLVRATAVELARGYGRKTLLVDLHGDGRDHLAMLGAQPIQRLDDAGPIAAINTVYPRLWIAFNAAQSPLADIHAEQDAIRRLIGDLREEFDRVLVVGTGALGNYATRRFTVLADANVIVVRGEGTSGPVARGQRDLVLGSGGTMLGFVYGDARAVIPPAVARLL